MNAAMNLCWVVLVIVFAQPGLAADNKLVLSPALQKLDADSAVLDGDVKTLSIRAHKVSQVLNASAKGLGVPSNLATVLTKLEISLKELDKAAEIVEVVPQAREDAKKLRSSIAPVLQDVTAAKNKARALADKLEPIRIKAAAASKNAENMSTGLALFDTDLLQNEPFATAISQTCVNRAADTRKTCMQTNVDAKAEEIDKLVLEMDRVIKPLVANYIPSMPALKALDDFNLKLKLLDDLQHQIALLESKIDVMMAPLKELENLLDKKFEVTFHLLGKHTFGIRMSIIVQGSNAIEKEIEHVLSKEVWKLAKDFGIGKLVKSLEEDAQKELNKTLSKLHLNPDISLPGIKDLAGIESAVNQLLAAFDNLSIPAFDLKLPDFGLPHIAHGFDLHLIGIDLKWLAPNGFYLQKPDVCKDISYQCK